MASICSGLDSAPDRLKKAANRPASTRLARYVRLPGGATAIPAPRPSRFARCSGRADAPSFDEVPPRASAALAARAAPRHLPPNGRRGVLPRHCERVAQQPVIFEFAFASRFVPSRFHARARRSAWGRRERRRARGPFWFPWSKGLHSISGFSFEPARGKRCESWQDGHRVARRRG